MAAFSRMLRTLLLGLSVASAHAAGAGEVELRWQPPDERTTGEELALSDLAGYRIYYGPSPEADVGVIEVRDPELTGVLVQGLPTEDDYYFAITAYDAQGRESARSNSIRARPE